MHKNIKMHHFHCFTCFLSFLMPVFLLTVFDELSCLPYNFHAFVMYVVFVSFMFCIFVHVSYISKYFIWIWISPLAVLGQYPTPPHAGGMGWEGASGVDNRRKDAKNCRSSFTAKGLIKINMTYPKTKQKYINMHENIEQCLTNLWECMSINDMCMKMYDNV